MPIFPLTKMDPGDLIFFYKAADDGKTTDGTAEMREAITAASVVDCFANIFHVGLVIDGSEQIIHATDNGVVIQSFEESISELKPLSVELCEVVLDDGWKLRAVNRAIEELGSSYNDLFSPECLNSEGKRAFYCSQLVVESYISADHDGRSPFLPHKMNFLDAHQEQLIPYWVEYFRKLNPQNPKVPHGRPGSHPSKLRASHTILHTSATRYFYEFEKNSTKRMKKFSIPIDLPGALHFISGARVNLTAGRKIKVIEPRNGNLLAECHSANNEEIYGVASHASEAQKKWSKVPWIERREILSRTAYLLRKHVNELSEWEVRDNGKPISEAKADVLSCADTFDYFSGVNLAGEHIPYDERGGRFAYTRREPFGVVGAIGAWNYPIQTASWKIAPSIACGNSILYKPSPLAPISSVLLASVLQCAGLPDGVVNIVQGGPETGTAMCECPQIRKVSFTGSVQTGKAIARACASQNIKPVTLELGGKSACIIFDDADIEIAVNGAMLANFLSQGQVCTNASKILVHRSVLGEFTKLVIRKTENLRIGDPLNEMTNVGACISLEHLKKVQDYIQSALQEGASLLTGGERVTILGLEDGFYLSPSVLNNINPEMRVYREEIFGPVMLLIPFETDEEALKIANDTEFGLAAGIFTKELQRAHSFAAQLNAGNVYINTYNDVHPNVPFGGFNQSGYGRENGEAAMWNYTQIKSVYMNISNDLEHFNSN